MTSADALAAALKRHDTVKATYRLDDISIDVERDHEYSGALSPVRLMASAELVDAAMLEDAAARGSQALVVVGSGAYPWALKDRARQLGVGLFTIRQLFGALNDENIALYDHNSVEYFVKRVNAHRQVDHLERLNEFVFLVHRESGLDPLLIYVADEYTLSEAFVLDVIDEHPRLDIIANLSSWNSYTPQAASTARDAGVRVLDLSGITAALFRDREWIVDYTPQVGY